VSLIKIASTMFQQIALHNRKRINENLEERYISKLSSF